jgi:hypothetical protein
MEKSYGALPPMPGMPTAVFSIAFERPLITRDLTRAHCGILVDVPFVLSETTRTAISRLSSLVAFVISQLPPQLHSGQKEVYGFTAGNILVDAARVIC